MIYISKYPVRITYNTDNVIETNFVLNDKEELDNYKKFDRRLLFLHYISLYDFNMICINHLPEYGHATDVDGIMKRNECECKKIHLWSSFDVHLRVGKEIVTR